MNKQTLILLIAIVLILIPTGVALKAYTVDEFEILDHEAGTAYGVAYVSTSRKLKLDENKPAPAPAKTLCDACKGTKTVLTPDKVTRIACECGSNCKCQPMSATPEVEKVNKRILLITAVKWCSWCKVIDRDVIPALESTGWKFGENEHIQIVDFDTETELVEKYKAELLPTWILLEDDKEVKRYVGFLNGWGVGKLWDKGEITQADTVQIPFKAKKK